MVGQQLVDHLLSRNHRTDMQNVGISVGSMFGGGGGSLIPA